MAVQNSNESGNGVPRWVAIAGVCVLMFVSNLNTSLALFSAGALLAGLAFCALWGFLLHVATKNTIETYFVGVGAYLTSVVFLLILMLVDSTVNLLGARGRSALGELWMAHVNLLSLAFDYIVVYRLVWVRLHKRYSRQYPG